MRSLTCRFLAAACVIGLVIAGHAQQVADPDFDPNVATPAYTKKHPKVLLDEAHHNFYTASGRYKPFADLITSDGYQVTPTEQTQASAAGRAQGLAFKLGKGRVVVLGEAGMLSAQLTGPRKMKFGMNRSGIDNRQLALNIMHWLSGLLK